MNPISVIGPRALDDLRAAASEAPPGDFVEVGVYKGGSAAVLAEVARARGRRLFLFDTFSGMPHSEQGVDHHVVGDFGSAFPVCSRQRCTTTSARSRSRISTVTSTQASRRVVANLLHAWLRAE
jgi:hypothetical protein